MALWVRESAGEAAFRDTLRRMSRWALERNDEGPIHLGHRLGHVRQDPQRFRAVVYDKGAWVLHMLRGIVGEEAFRTALGRLQADHRYGKIGSDDLREALEAASGLRLSAYFDEWVYGTRLPSLSVRHASQPAGVGFRTQVTVAATDLPGPVPLELAVSHAAGRETRRVELTAQGGSFEFSTPGRVRRVDVNGDYGLLARIDRH